MASEKGDLPQDTDSLPPNYATSEVYTDSPPPAYRKTNTVRLQITRVVCLTIILSGILIGTFILAHTWITTRDACDCPKVAANFLPSSEALVQASVFDVAPKISEVSNNLEMTDLDQESRQLDIPLPLDEEEINEDLKIMEEVIEDEAASLQNLDEPKRVKLPINMILGNPQVAGKDVECRVEKKIRNLGNGVLSKTIMMVCDDDNSEGKAIENAPSPLGSLFGARPLPRPPMSLLAPILKMMSARANARFQGQMKPKIVVRRFPQPMGSFPQPFPISGQMSFPPPFLNSEIEDNENMSPPRPMPFQGNNIIEGKMIHNNFFPQAPEQNMPFGFMPDNLNEEAPNNMIFREHSEREHEPIFMPLPPKKEGDGEFGPNRFPPQIPDAIKEIVSNILKRKDQSKLPIISMKVLPEQRSIEEAPPKFNMMLPFPFRPMKVQTRGARKLNIDEETNEAPFPFSPNGLKRIIMPEAGGRGLDNNPVTLPSLQEKSHLGFILGPHLRLPMPLQGRAITHMEMKQLPNAVQFDNENDNVEENSPIIEEEAIEEPFGQPLQDTDVEEPFGPPRDETVITREPPIIITGAPLLMDEEDASPISPFVAQFPPPPPPTYAREGRTGFVREINPEAELLTTAETRGHHVLSVN